MKLRPFTAILIASGASACVISFFVGLVLSLILNGSALTVFQLAFFGSAATVLARGAIRIAVEADEHEIVVTNLWKTHQLHWQTVDGIETAWGLWPGASLLTWAKPPLRIRTRDGRSVYVQASVDNPERVAQFLRASSTHAAKVTWKVRSKRAEV